MADKMNKVSVEELKEKFSGLCGDAKLRGIVDYSAEDMIVIYGSKDVIPGIMFRVNKKTGKTAVFSPAEDLVGFSKAAKERSVSFDD